MPKQAKRQLNIIISKAITQSSLFRINLFINIHYKLITKTINQTKQFNKTFPHTNNTMISRMITHTKTLKRKSRQFMKNSTLCMQKAIGKYQLINKFFIVGTVANLYFCCISFVKYSIYSQVSHNIMQKFEEFNNTKTKNREVIFQLMKEMDTMHSQRSQPTALINDAKSFEDFRPINQIKNNYSPKAERKEIAQQKKRQFSFQGIATSRQTKQNNQKGRIYLTVDSLIYRQINFSFSFVTLPRMFKLDKVDKQLTKKLSQSLRGQNKNSKQLKTGCESLLIRSVIIQDQEFDEILQVINAEVRDELIDIFFSLLSSSGIVQ